MRRIVGAGSRGGDSGAAMMTALWAMLITAMLSILVLGMMVAQVRPTAFLRTGSQTIFAAEAGVNAVLGQIRTAKDAPDITGAVYGDPTRLPCTASGPVDGTGTTLRYEAEIDYYLLDPSGKSDAWLAANALPCTAGGGPTKDPAYALITSHGVGDTISGMDASYSERSVQAVYEFQLTNANIPGGIIYSFDANASEANQYCLEADSPTVGSYVSYVPAADCGNDDITQLWIYDKTYQIKLASTTVPALFPDPLCIARPTGTLPVRAKLEVCQAPTAAARWNQLWSWEGGATYRGQSNPVSAGYATAYLYSGTTSGQPGGRDLWVGGSGTKASDAAWGSFNPDARVGAGAAGSEQGQLVNYLEFGRCFDVTDQTPSKAFMIVYPCKQDPSGAPVFWNHHWYYNEPPGKVGSLGPQQIYVLQDNLSTKKFCLVSPNSENGYVTLTSACNASALSQRWTRYANMGDYGTSYTVVDNWGRCLAAGGGDYNGWSKVVVQTCNGSLGQKWNAPPSTVSASVDGYVELH